MEKDALLEILSHDLKEVDHLIQSVKGEKALSQAFFRLTRNRIKSILEELDMLEELSVPEKPANAEFSNPETETPDSEADTEFHNQPTAPSSKAEKAKESLDSEEEQPSGNINIEAKEKEEVKSVPPQAEPILQNETTTETEKKMSPSQETETEKEAVYPESEETEKTPVKKEFKPQEPKKETKVLGEKLNTGKSSFNEQIAKNKTASPKKRSFTSPPINDLRKAIGINDRFFFQRELFSNNADLMNQTLDQLNEMKDIQDAQNFLLANFNWDPENEAVLQFMELVERRYL